MGSNPDAGTFMCLFTDVVEGDEAPQVARARTTDPDTSHAAAASVGDLSRAQRAVHRVLARFGPMTDVELVREYHRCVDDGMEPRLSDSGIRSRRAELVRLGRVEHVDYMTLETGRRARVWGAS